ncbi:hypothetical protein MPTK1_1g22650 [Marchantia polymorpha subsp. ruderalis]|uniref:GIL1/IRKI C-terminal domain-containing protein n=2 Tax=Marchantia polymorpha TaxID=3197 RepID=A0AAF6AT70_MARPO|nr:hypothetical protein MARPO_0118s0022 [Marchantia polymorpha]PTQ30886.1 hypothetical protein MARPO_0118s0022 [Marchantia polymorpha]BBM99639.1 hypothetical protein Mp_1g22650 [Marchantia polymorpha subsp. ruderalis]BBM99640.1 hypothetical protein Mp_1g22650 [Marchantia polymorpha subsp. ruderalis]|eukprot:PTQ30885.1 hypothetical protein MARPO_0118s0022 [Marchantia polymorpha]
MERNYTQERVMHRAAHHQDYRGRVPSSVGSSPSSDCGESCVRVNYRYYPTGDYHTAPMHSMECSVDHCVKQSNARHQKGRSLSLSEPNNGFLDDSHTAPLMFYSDDALREVCQKGARRGPFRQIGSMLGCFFRRGRDTNEKKAWAKSRALALLELSKRQQTALAMKQDTIEMLEWKLEQLQAHSAATPDTIFLPSIPHAKESYPEMNFVAPSTVGGIRYSESSSDTSSAAEERGKARHDRNHVPQAEEPFLDFQTLKLQDAELSAIVHLFEMAVVKARLAVRYFCKVFMKQMEVSGYSVWRTLAEIEPQTKFLKKEHTAFVLESRLNRALFHCFENDSFDDTGLTRIIDPEKRCIARFQDFQRLKLVEAIQAVNSQHKAFDPEFWTFCENKMREMWFLFPWNIVFKDSEERSTFTGAFLDAAKCVWLLHRLAFSVHPQVTILRVGKGMDANSQYVEQVTAIDEGCRRCQGPKVEFMSMPGFQIHKKIIKCQVYRHLRCK